MCKLFRYPPYKIIFPYGLILFIPVFSFYIWFSFGMSKFGVMFNAIYWGINIGLGVTILAWIINNLSVRITLDDQGVTCKSRLKSTSINWGDVKSVQWRILYEGQQTDSHKPSDIIIYSRDGQKISIFSVAQQHGGENGGITELEMYIQSKVPSAVGKKEQQIKSESQRQLKLTVIAGFLILICGAIMFKRPLHPNMEKFGVISKQIGMSADAIILILGGIVLVGWGLNQLGKPPK